MRKITFNTSTYTKNYICQKANTSTVLPHSPSAEHNIQLSLWHFDMRQPCLNLTNVNNAKRAAAMEDKLQEILRVQPLLERLTIARESISTYAKDLRKICSNEMKNMIHVEIDVSKTELILPDAQKVPPLPDACELPQLSLDLSELQQDIVAMERILALSKPASMPHN